MQPWIVFTYHRSLGDIFVQDRISYRWHFYKYYGKYQSVAPMGAEISALPWNSLN